MLRAPSILCASVLVGAPLACQQAPSTSHAEPNVLTAEERGQGFYLLFDGVTTEGWRGFNLDAMPDGWQVVDGTMTRVGAGGDVLTVAQFENFELRFEWMVQAGGNSGIMFRVSEQEERTFHSGPEFQILDDAMHADGQSRLTAAGSNYGLHAAPVGIVRSPGQWNTARIIVDGAHVEHWLNDVKIVEYELWSDEWERLVANSKFVEWPEYGRSRRGHIALQDHGDEVSFRSIRLRELP